MRLLQHLQTTTDVLSLLVSCGSIAAATLFSSGQEPGNYVSSSSTSSESAAVACLAYVFNPLTLLAVGSGQLVLNAAIALAFAVASGGMISTTVALVVGLAATVPIQGLCLGPPLLLLSWARRRLLGSAHILVDAGGLCVVAAVAISLPDSVWYPSLALHSVNTSTLAVSWPPELGLSWYLLSSAYIRYLPYFATLVWLHPFAYVTPVALRLHAYPAAAAVVTLCLACLFDPSDAYSLVRAPLCMSLALTLNGAVREMRDCTIVLGVLAVVLAVAPTIKSAWIVAPYGNANLLFNLQLVFALCGGLLTAEFAAGALRAVRAERRYLRSNERVVHSVQRPCAQ